MQYGVYLMCKYYALFLLTAGLAAACIGLLTFRYLYSGTTFNGSVYFGFLIWNLFLAGLPLLFAVLAAESSRRVAIVGFGLAALAFLPNAFYIITDLIHLNPAQAGTENLGTGFTDLLNRPYVGPGVLFDAAMLFMFALSGCIFGVLAIDRLKLTVAKYANPTLTWTVIIAGIFLSSFAIYIGRVLRWNTWDFLTNPLGLAADIFDIFTKPIANAQAWGMTALFFVITCALYVTFKLVRRL